MILRCKRNNKGGVSFHCPGCNERHVLNIDAIDRPRWSWNNSVESPTFQPSVLVQSANPNLVGDEWKQYDEFCRANGAEAVFAHPKFGWRCHSFVTDGRIQFLDDCTHALKGTTVDLPELSQ